MINLGKNDGRNSPGSQRCSRPCDARRGLKKWRYGEEEAIANVDAYERFQKAAMIAKEDWIGIRCEEIENCLNKKRDLTRETG